MKFQLEIINEIRLGGLGGAFSTEFGVVLLLFINCCRNFSYCGECDGVLLDGLILFWFKRFKPTFAITGVLELASDDGGFDFEFELEETGVIVIVW